MKFFVSVLFLSFSLFSFSQQDSSLIYIYNNPSGNYRVKINNELMPETHVFKALSGKYKIQVWAPNYYIKDTSIVLTNEPCTIKTKLDKTPELIKYQQLKYQHGLYNNKILFLGTASFIGLSSMGIAMAYNPKANLNKIKAENGYLYQVGGYNIDIFRDAKRKLLINKSIIYSGGAIFVGGIYLLYKTIKKQQVLEKPELKEDNFFILEDVGFNLNNNQKQLNLSIRF